MIDPATFPTSGPYRLANAQVPSVLLDGIPTPTTGLATVCVDIAEGRIAAIHAVDAAPPVAYPAVDLQQRQLWPALVDMHTHLDKGHIWPRRDNPDGTFMSALMAVEADRAAHWSAEDVAARMDFSLRCAYAHGSRAIRTHLDSHAPQHGISWPVFVQTRERWAGRIDLQAVCLILLDEEVIGPWGDEIADLVAASRGVMGAVPVPHPEQDRLLRRVFALAAERELDLDFHVDESLDPGATSLGRIAAIAQEVDFPGQIVVGHCCSLSVQPEVVINATLDAVAAAGIGVVSLPMCNLYLQDRVPGRTPRYRGVTLLHEMQARGIPVAVASDNTRDPFYGYGDLDLMEVFTQAARIAHLDRPVDPWPAAVGPTPARLMGLDAGVIRVGQPADLIIWEGRGFDELLSRPQSRRVVLRNGQPIDTTPPDYRELDHLFH